MVNPIGGVMTEIMPDYRTEAKIKTVGVTWCRCPKCKAVFGYEVEGGAYLRVGRLKIRTMRSECGDCGYPIWWYSSDRLIKRIAHLPTE